MALAPELAAAVEGIRLNSLGGARSLAAAAVAVLRRASDQRQVVDVARALCRAQPSMAPIWNAAIHAVASSPGNHGLDRFVARSERAPQALVRFALDILTTGFGQRPFRVTTISASSSVQQVIEALSARLPVAVTCAEGRPALEGRRLAQQLVSPTVSVSLCTDAALALGLERCDAVLVGADAVGPDHFINKAGTLMLAAAAAARGVPVYVLATRDKFAMPELWPHITISGGPVNDIWPSAPVGVHLHNPYFEATPLEMVSSLISDAGVMGADAIRQACVSLSEPRLVTALEAIVGL